jgi:hypothetical protein
MKSDYMSSVGRPVWRSISTMRHRNPEASWKPRGVCDAKLHGMICPIAATPKKMPHPAGNTPWVWASRRDVPRWDCTYKIKCGSRAWHECEEAVACTMDSCSAWTLGSSLAGPWITSDGETDDTACSKKINDAGVRRSKANCTSDSHASSLNPNSGSSITTSWRLRR